MVRMIASLGGGVNVPRLRTFRNIISILSTSTGFKEFRGTLEGKSGLP